MNAPHRRPAFLLAAAALLVSPTFGQEPAGNEPAGEQEIPARPAARLIRVESPVDDAVAGAVQNAALELQATADREDRDAVLVLELTPGTSRFGPVRDLAQFLTSARLADVKTVAWVPESIDGNNVVLALACDEIVMHPDAELGDIGRGQRVDEADRQFVLTLVDRRHNRQVNAALAEGLLDPGAEVLKARIGDGPNAVVRVVSPDELRRLRDTATGAIDVEVVKDAGTPARFSGAEARALGVLVARTATDRRELFEDYGLPRDALRQDAAAGGHRQVAYIEIHDVIGPVIGEFVKRQIQRSVAAGATLIIFEIDSPGGYITVGLDMARRMAELSEQGVRTVAYVPHHALSMAAVLALACDEIYMEPGATLGDAGPLEMRAGGAMERADEKVLSVMRKELREIAESKGRPGALAEAMADKDLVVRRATNNRTGRVWYLTEAELHREAGEWKEGPAVPESRAGNLLTVGAERAHELKLAEPPVADVDELKARLGIPDAATLRPVGPTWIDTLVFALNSWAAMAVLFVLGVVLLYLELHLMTGLLGILSVLCFALFFWSKFLGGTAGWLEVVLFLLGIACLAMEILVIPGFGVFGITGGLLMLGSILMAAQTFQSAFVLQDMSRSMGAVVAAMVAFLLFSVTANRYLPRMPMFSQMILAPPGSEPSRTLFPEGLEEEYDHAPAVRPGSVGVARSTLRPAGKAEINAEYLDVVSDGPFIDTGARIEVLRREGNRVVVREVG